MKSYTCRPYKWGNNETCTIAKPDEGDWYVMLQAYSDYSGVSLLASYEASVVGIEPIVFENLTAKKGNMLLEQNGDPFVTSIESGMTKMSVTISGGTGDADLYVRHGSEPTRRLADCKPFKDGNEEVCTIEGAELKVGDWYIGVQAFEDFAGLRLYIEIEN